MSRDTLAQLLPHIIELKEAVARTEQKLANLTDVPERLDALERDIYGARLLGRVALGAAAVMGAVVTWSVDLWAKVKHAVN